MKNRDLKKIKSEMNMIINTIRLTNTIRGGEKDEKDRNNSQIDDIKNG